jgi:tetratricopeptide (TPR) repeat protein
MKYPPSIDSLIKEAQKAYKKQDYAHAAQSFRSAAVALSGVGDELAAAEMLNNTSVAYLQAGYPELALETAAGTDKKFAAANDIKRQAIAIGNQAAALEGLGKLEEALSLFETSADLLKQCGELELRASVMQSLSAVQLRLGRQLEALASMQAGLENIPHPTAKQRLVKKILRSPLDYFGRSS